MSRAHYGLQALLYTVALHRYLRWRLPGYDPSEHLAGVLYLFLRGMAGADTPVLDGTPCGVFAWRPPAALVRALSDVLDEGGPRDERVRADRVRIAFDCAGSRRRAAGSLREFNRIGVLSSGRRARRRADRAARRRVAIAAVIARGRARRPRARGSATCSSTWRRSPRPRPSSPRNRSISACCRGRRPEEWVAGVRVQRARRGRRRRAGRGGRAAAPGSRARGSTSIATGSEERRVAEDLRRAQRRRGSGRRSGGRSRPGSSACSRPARRAPAGGRGGRGAPPPRRRRRAARAPARRRPSRGSSRCSASRPAAAGARRSSRSRRRPGRRRRGSPRRSTTRPRRSTTSEEIRALLLGLRASTLHRLLGWRPGSHSRFRHDRENRLPHDVVIVDETSMVSLSLMARLVEAVRPDARLILVGDPGQLTSIEAGVVLGDIVGPAASRLRISPAGRQRLTEATGDTIPAEDPPVGVTIGDGIIVLDRVYRYGSAVASLADAIRVGDADAAIDVLRAEHDEITWLPVAFGEDAEDPATVELPAVKAASLQAGRAVVTAARAGDGDGALRALAGFRLLCAHRRGPFGVSAWSGRQQAWLAEVIDDLGLDGRDYVGRPLLVTENDYELGLYNGDTGVIVRTGEDHAVAMFERAGRARRLQPVAARVGRNRLRDDDPQEPGIAVRHGGGAAAARRFADPHPGAAVHRGDAGPFGAHPRRVRGHGTRRGRASGDPGLGPARAAVGVTRQSVSRRRATPSVSRRRATPRTDPMAPARAASPPRRSGRRG